MSFYIYSSLQNSNYYTIFESGRGGLKVPAKSVHIKGGAGISTTQFITPKGVMTEVSDEEMEALELNVVFNRQKARGYISVEKRKVSIDKVVKNMEKKSKSSPTTPEDFPFDANSDSPQKVRPVGDKKRNK